MPDGDNPRSAVRSSASPGVVSSGTNGSLLRRLRRSFVIGALLIGLPLAIAASFGVYSLLRRGEGLLLVSLSVCSILAGMLIVRRAVRSVLREEERFLAQRTQGPELHWSGAALAAWDAVTTCAADIRAGRHDLADANAVRAQIESLARNIASQLHPSSEMPLLEFTAGDLALASEQAVRELRELFVERIPLHGEIRIADVVRGHGTWEQAQSAFDLYRMIRLAVNPLGALMGEIQGVLSRRLAGELSDETTRWAVASAVELLGRYLVSLYAGEVLERRPNQPMRSVAALEKEQGSLSILIAGETKAGKSSLANALFGTDISPTSPVPETQGFASRKTEIEGLGEVNLYDTPGYDAGKESHRIFEKLVERAQQIELLVLVTAATSPARASDRMLLDRVRSGDSPPQVLVALTKIDLLRPFGRWNPPYEVESPSEHSEEQDRLKAESIRGAILATSEQLNVPPDRIVPVMVRSIDDCYNIDLFSALAADLLPSMRRALFRRILREQKDERFWTSLSEGLRHSGRFVVRRGVDLALKQVRTKV